MYLFFASKTKIQIKKKTVVFCHVADVVNYSVSIIKSNAFVTILTQICTEQFAFGQHEGRICGHFCTLLLKYMDETTADLQFNCLLLTALSCNQISNKFYIYCCICICRLV